jgi:hypothetical protein
MVELTLYKKKGMRMNAIAGNLKREPAQPTLSLLYIAVAKSRKPAPNDDLMKSFPANADAATFGYASGR